MKSGIKSIDLKVIVILLISLTLTSCSFFSDELPVTQDEAVRTWNDTYMVDCFAPRDYGTSRYPTDQLEQDCWRRILLNVTQEKENVYCFEQAWQTSYKYSDAYGFGVSEIQHRIVCHPFSRGYSDKNEVIIYGKTSATELGTLDYWPN